MLNVRTFVARIARPLSVVCATGLVFLTLAPIAVADNGPEHRVQQATPIKLGCTGGNVNDRWAFIRSCCSGTLGCLVKTEERPSYYVLSNNHVLAMINRGHVGDAIIHPGLIDAGCLPSNAFTVAHLSQWVPISFGSWNVVDAAIAGIVPGMISIGADNILDIPAVCNTTVSPYLGMLVQKSGRTSGYTVGIVTMLNVAIRVGYPTYCGSSYTNIAFFAWQIGIQPIVAGQAFTMPGDSGSVVFWNEGSSMTHAVGLLFAGWPFLGFANPIQPVLDSFGVTIVGNQCLTTPEPPTLSYTQEEMEAVAAVQERLSARLLRRSNVHGHGIELDENGRLRIVVFLDSLAGVPPRPIYRNGVEFRPMLTGPIPALDASPEEMR